MKDGAKALDPEAIEQALLALPRALEALAAAIPALAHLKGVVEEKGPAVLTTRQVAGLLGVSTQYVREAIAAGRLQAQRYGRVYRIEQAEMLRLKAASRINADAGAAHPLPFR